LVDDEKPDTADDVLDHNPFEIDPYALPESGVVMTMLDGTIVYDRDDADAGC
jgi:predicted amidohydrolase YtcJ